MPLYCIIETDDGYTVVEHPEGETAEQTALRTGGVVVDPGPYESYEEACEALDALQAELDDEDPSDLPSTQAWEGRYETDD